MIQTSQQKRKFHNSKSTYTSTCATLTVALYEFWIHIQKDMKLLIEKEIIVRKAALFTNSQHRSGHKAAAFSYWSHHVTGITDEIFFIVMQWILPLLTAIITNDIRIVNVCIQIASKRVLSLCRNCWHKLKRRMLMANMIISEITFSL